MPRKTPREIAEGAADRLCAYDAVTAPGDCRSTQDRIADFLREFVLVITPRLEAVAKQEEWEASLANGREHSIGRKPASSKPSGRRGVGRDQGHGPAGASTP